MSTESYLIIVSCIVSGIVGVILSRQIKSQKEIIDKYKDFIDALDISKFKEYSKLVEELGEKKLEIERANLAQEIEKKSEYYRDHYSQYFTEIALFAVWTVNGMKRDRSEKLRFLKEAFPLSYPLIESRIL